MSRIDGLLHRLHVLWRGERYSDEIARELGFHAELEALARRGEHAEHLTAELAARRALGNVTYYREEVRRMTPLAWFDAARQDFAYAWRGLVRSPGFTIAVILTLGLGIGVNASLFAFLDVLFVRQPHGLVGPADVRRLYADVENHREPGRLVHDHFPYPFFRAIVAAEDTSLVLAAFTPPDSAAVVTADSRVPIRRSYVTGGYFPLIGIRPHRGRFFIGDESRIESPTLVAVLSDAFWRRHFQSDERVLGRTVTINTRAFTIVGIAPPGFTGIDIDAVDVWLPANALPSSPGRSGEPWYETFQNSFGIVARVPSALPLANLTLAATSAVRSVRLEGFVYDSTETVRTGPVARAAGPGERAQEVSISTRLAGVTLIVLLIACANVTNLFLVRATRRRREIALRRALGVSSPRLRGQVLTESLLVTALGGAAALLFAFWAATALRSLLFPRVRWAEPAIEWRSAAFIGIVTVLAGIATGLAPALQATRPDLMNWLKAGAHESTYHRSRLRSALLIIQATLSVVLLVGAGLFVRSLDNVRALDLGYDVDHTLFVAPSFISPPPPTEIASGLVQVSERLRGANIVEAVALASSSPMQGFSFLRVLLPDRDSLPAFGNEKSPSMIAVSPDYFRAAGVSVLAGRSFTVGDRHGAPGVVVVSRAMARLYWPSVSPIGQCLIVGDRRSPCSTVVGVVADVHRMELIEKPTLQFYAPLDQVDALFAPRELIIRVRERDATAAATLGSQELRKAFPRMLPARMRTMAQVLDPQFRPWRVGAELFTSLGVLALIVAAIGVYSVIAYVVSQRTREIGIRIALGARAADVLTLVVGEGARLVGIGVALGIVIALAAGRLVAALLYGISAHDPPVLAGAALVLILVGVAATLLPSWRATKVDPVVALRSD